MAATDPSILIVDDEEDTCRNLADIFADLGFRVATAHDGPAALDLLRQQRYDVALLDMMMPGMDGLTLYQEVKKVRPGTVAVVVTAHPGNPRAAQALAAGAWKLVPKPVDFPLLMGVVDEVVGQPLLLVVDDDPDLCASLWDILRERGYRVCLAHDVAAAAEHLREDGYRAILLDMRLPGGDGAAVFQIARQAAPEAKVVLVTGHGVELEHQIRQVLAEGAQGILHKPLDVPKLLETLSQLTA
jgi:DNA-binding NtrC family response regulator